MTKKIYITFSVVGIAVMLFPVVLSAKEFKVADYGAIGDGKTDDGQAVRKAVAAAIKAGPGSKVVFEKKKYRLARYSKQPHHITLKDVSGITIDGNGAEISNNPYNGFISIDGCSNVTMRGFYFDCDPLSFTQGDIVSVEPDKGEFLVKIHKGYANPVKLSEKMGKKMWGQVGFTIDPVERKLKRRGPDHYRIESVTEWSGNNKLVHIKLQSKTCHHIKKGDRFIISLIYGGSGATISVKSSSDIHLENYTIYNSKFEMNHFFSGNHGRVYVKGAKITFRPGTDRLVTSIKDGFHVKHNDVGPVIEDCLLEGMMDDSINISVCPYWVKEYLGGNKYLIIGKARKGDTLMAYTPNPGTVIHELKVLKVEPQETPKGYPGWSRFCIVTLNKPIPDLGLFKGKDTFLGGHEKMKFTGLYNLDASGKDYIIRNNIFLAQRRHAVLARTTGGLIEDNIIDGVGGCGINLGNEAGSFYEGPFPGHTVIRNNTFRNTVRTPINVYTHGNNAWAKDITVTNNTFSGFAGAAIQLRNVDGGIIEGNTIYRTPSDSTSPDKPDWIDQKNCKNVSIRKNQTPLSAAKLDVSDYGAVGDGKTDDGPAIAAAFAAAKKCAGGATVVFAKKTYKLGDNPKAWHYFQMNDFTDLVIEGNGATLVCSDANLGFHFNGGRNITVRGLVFDVTAPRVSQGEVIAVHTDGYLDVKIMDDYPSPPDDAFLKVNGYRAYGGGGRHMIVFENGGKSRNTKMLNDHLYISNIKKISAGVFRFFVKDNYMPSFAGVAVGNWITYGLNKVNLPASVVAAKNKSASIYAQIAADRVENITFENISIYGSLNGGIRVSDMPGDVILRNVNIIRKPGTRNLLSTCSDALHLMNIRGRLIMENCVIESPGDDCLNVGTMRERIIALLAADKKVVTLRTVDNWYYYYTIRKGDRLQFFNTATKRILGVTKVADVVFNRSQRTHKVTLDREISGLDVETVQVMNLDQMTRSTVIRNNIIKPYMRNGLLARAQNMTIENNTLDCSAGGVIGLNMSYASGGDNAQCRNITIKGNTFSCPDNRGIVLLNPYRDADGVYDAQRIEIIDNVFEVGTAKAIRLNGIQSLSLRGNTFKKNGEPVKDASKFTIFSNCVDAVVEN